ncbi:MAG: hypothetical protein M1826_002484 [Phylliscum demangeonii]|nr:MAG: hypothetical protein M1826_002484 [Phylliscum demangeonii]
MEHPGTSAGGVVRELWRPTAPEKTQMYHFKEQISQKYQVHLADYNDLYRWSIAHLPLFWQEVWRFTRIKASKPYSKVLEPDAPMFPRPSFFLDARLNFAENLLYPASQPSANCLALIAVTEHDCEHVTWAQLRARVHACAAALVTTGVKASDRVVAYVGNHANAVVAMLAATSIGAIYTTISPDTGVYATLERLVQIEPVMLFADADGIYNGKRHAFAEKIRAITRELPSLKAVAVFDPTAASEPDEIQSLQQADDRVRRYSAWAENEPPAVHQHFPQLPPDHPVYLLYSSEPKCMVHGAAGTLIAHKKEHTLACDLKPGLDRLFYYTTTAWMMWHWLVSALASGVTIVLYDGSPFRSRQMESHDPLALPRLIDELGITHFGTSAKYLSLQEQAAVMPRPSLAMSKLRAVYSTGSPLAPSTFEYVYRAFGPDLHLASITGGTDILSLFGAPSPISPVYVGEVQVRGLGMAVEAWDPDGHDVTASGETGDLVCVQPFPSQPAMFWQDPDGELYRASYFARFPGRWLHGDFIKINPVTGGLVMLGRSDGTLKPAGVRFGSAEIYNVLLESFPGEMTDALCVGRRRASDDDETVILFLRMAAGHSFTKALQSAVKAKIRTCLSARHVPAVVDECPDIPVTANGKKVEIVVKQILSGGHPRASSSLANPESLKWYQQWADAHP